MISCCDAFKRNLYVSSSTLRTRFSCVKESIRFNKCSRLTINWLGFVVDESAIDETSDSHSLSVCIEWTKLFTKLKKSLHFYLKQNCDYFSALIVLLNDE